MQTIKTGDPVNELYGNIVIDADGTFVPYIAVADSEDESILIIEADISDNYASEKGLYLNNEILDQFTSEGYEMVRFINSKAIVEINLNEITGTSFETYMVIESIVVSTDPQAEDEIGLKVEALFENGDKLLAITVNGIYLPNEDKELILS